MRLAQIARKLQTTPSVIIKFIEQTFEVEIPSAPNTKIPDEYVTTILEHFSPEIIEKEITEVVTEAEGLTPEIKQPKVKEASENKLAPITHSEREEEEKKEKVVKPTSPKVEKEEKKEVKPISPELKKEVKKDEKEKSPKVKEEKKEKESVNVNEEISEELEELNIEDGVIKAPKIEVRGIKVIDKIELPSKQEKEIEEVEEDIKEGDDIESKESQSVETKNEVPEDQPITKPKVKENDTPKPKKPTVPSHQEQLQKELIAFEKELQIKREKEKRKKKTRYEQLMRERKALKKNGPKKSEPNVKSKKKQKQTADIEQAQMKPKTTWGKFIKWLNT